MGDSDIKYKSAKTNWFLIFLCPFSSSCILLSLLSTLNNSKFYSECETITGSCRGLVHYITAA